MRTYLWWQDSALAAYLRNRLLLAKSSREYHLGLRLLRPLCADLHWVPLRKGCSEAVGQVFY